MPGRLVVGVRGFVPPGRYCGLWRGWPEVIKHAGPARKYQNQVD
jgi:hypothetical protein